MLIVNGAAWMPLPGLPHVFVDCFLPVTFLLDYEVTFLPLSAHRNLNIATFAAAVIQSKQGDLFFMRQYADDAHEIF